MCRERSSMRVWKTHGENVKKDVSRLKHAIIGFGIQTKTQGTREFAPLHQVFLLYFFFAESC